VNAQRDYADLVQRGLTLDLTRGKPSPRQLDLSDDLLRLPTSYRTADGTDGRNYGGLQGLPELRELFAPLLQVPAGRLVVGGNSSLAMMHDTVVHALLSPVPGATRRWVEEPEITFLCPVPGYDRHFTICERFGIKMVAVPMGAGGPDMDEVERLVAGDAAIRGMWCMPKYSNPTGTVYSSAVVERLGAMKTAAPDFRIFWDNAYAVHHLTPERIEIANLLELSARHGHPNRPFVFASTSKITLAGAGLAVFAASEANVKWFLARITPRTIGPDKINQLRHVRFLENEAGILALMDRHRAIIAPKFQKVLDVFDQELAGLPDVTWTRPKGGYFISLDVPPGCARRVVALARDAGIELTPAGSTHPLGKDPDDRTIRIAPTFPELPEVALAAEGVALCVLLASAERSSARL
jgi:DNA-binding transcriptional MocR family regulator